MSDETENSKEGIDLRPDGGVHIWIDGRQHRLRRPRGREFRKLREELGDHLDSINAATNEAVAWSERLKKLSDERDERGEQRLTPEERAEDVRRGREIRDLTETAIARWWATALDTLCVHEQHDDLDLDDIPPWLIDTKRPLALLDHWRAAPSLSGVR